VYGNVCFTSPPPSSRRVKHTFNMFNHSDFFREKQPSTTWKYRGFIQCDLRNMVYNIVYVIPPTYVSYNHFDCCCCCCCVVLGLPTDIARLKYVLYKSYRRRAIGDFRVCADVKPRGVSVRTVMMYNSVLSG